MRRMVTALLCLPVLLLGVGLGVGAGWGVGLAPARAATLDGMLSFAGFHVGAFRSSSGVSVYCLEPGADAPFGAQLEPGIIDSLPAYTIVVNDPWGFSGTVSTEEASGELLRRMNWVLAEHGEGASAERAVAVQIALWELRRGAGNSGWLDAKHALLAAHGGEPYIAEGLALASESETAAKAPGYAVPASGLMIAADAVHGSGTVSYPAGTVELSISGGTFLDGSTTLPVDPSLSGQASWSASLHEPEWAREHTVAISGRWSLEERYWLDEIVLHAPANETEQRLGAGISALTRANEGDFDAVSASIDGRFAPVITTAVIDGIVVRGDGGGEFGDVVTVSAAQEGAPWPSRGAPAEFLPLRADGVLYGPFTAPQPESAEPPSGAPVAARASIELDAGPGSYEVRETVESLESGHYYWVWSIREDAQSAVVRASGLLAPGAAYADAFGVHAERQTVPTVLRWMTRLDRVSSTPDDRVLRDSILVSLEGGAWLRDGAGERIPARIRLTAYQTDERPERLPLPPAGARDLGSVVVEVRGPGVWIAAPPFEVPSDASGWVSVRACLSADDQLPEVRGFFVEWCDDFGIPEETAELVAPEAPAHEETGQVLAITGDGRAGAALLVVLTAGTVAGIGLILVGIAGFRRSYGAFPNSIHRIGGNP